MESNPYYHTYSASPALLLFRVSFADKPAGVLWLSFKFSSLEKGRLPLSFFAPASFGVRPDPVFWRVARLLPMSGILLVMLHGL